LVACLRLYPWSLLLLLIVCLCCFSVTRWGNCELTSRVACCLALLVASIAITVGMYMGDCYGHYMRAEAPHGAIREAVCRHMSFLSSEVVVFLSVLFMLGGANIVLLQVMIMTAGECTGDAKLPFGFIIRPLYVPPMVDSPASDVDKSCVVCLVNKVTITLLCGHPIYCCGCAKLMAARRKPACAICREPIIMFVKFFG
jgi:hypothetical protein